MTDKSILTSLLPQDCLSKSKKKNDSQIEKGLALYLESVTFVDATLVSDSVSLQINRLLNMAILMPYLNAALGNRPPLDRIG